MVVNFCCGTYKIVIGYELYLSGLKLIARRIKASDIRPRDGDSLGAMNRGTSN
jgi:hypothetical protein